MSLDAIHSQDAGHVTSEGYTGPERRSGARRFPLTAPKGWMLQILPDTGRVAVVDVNQQYRGGGTADEVVAAGGMIPLSRPESEHAASLPETIAIPSVALSALRPYVTRPLDGVQDS